MTHRNSRPRLFYDQKYKKEEESSRPKGLLWTRVRQEYDSVKLVPEAPLRSKIKADLQIDELAIVESTPGPAKKWYEAGIWSDEIGA